MNIKNILLFSFMCITHYNVHTMDTRLPNEENDFLQLTKTSQYQAYIKTLKTDYAYSSSETKTDLDTAWKNLLKTNELQVMFHSKYQPIYDSSPTYLNIIHTSQYNTYNRAKKSHCAHRTRTTRESLEETFRCLLHTPEVQSMTPLNVDEPIYIPAKTTQSLNQKPSIDDNAQKEVKQTTHNNNNNNSQPSLNIQNSHFYGIKESVNVMATSQFQAITQTPKFQAIIQKPEFFIMMQTPQFQAFIRAISSQSSDRIQEALEGLLETEAIQLLFEAGILSDTIHAKFNAMQKTEAYDEYQTTKDYHKTWNTPDSQNMLDEYKEIWRSTKEYKELLDAANAEMFLNNSTQTFSDNVLEKYQAIKNTSEYIEYQNAKQSLKENNSDDIQDLIYCGLQLFAEENGHNLFVTINQKTEKHALNNIMQSEEWVTKQEYCLLFPMLKSTHDRTSHLQIKVIDFLFDKLEAQLSLTHSQNATNTEFINNSNHKKAKLNNNNNPNSCPNTATPLSNKEIAFLNMTQTQQYQAYERANKLHIEHNKPETKILLEEALGLLLQTQESQTLLQINNQEKTKTNNSQMYSEDVAKKNDALIATLEWQQFQKAKSDYEQNPSEDTRYIFTLCKEYLHATKECQEFIKATDKETHITNNIANAKKREAEQSHLNCQSIESMQIKRDNAWRIVQNTEEYQIFKQIKLAHQLQGTVENETLLSQCKQQARETSAYIHFFEIDQQLRTIKGQLQANNNHYTKNNNNSNNT